MSIKNINDHIESIRCGFLRFDLTNFPFDKLIILQEKKKKKVYSLAEAKLKGANYCAYRERSQKEVRDKLYDMGLYGNEVEDVLTELILDGFLNEERFAKAYARGKFRIKKWGRKKISIGLKQHGVSAYCLKMGMEEINEGDYLDMLEELILKKATVIAETDLFKKRNKIVSHVIYKGYEPELAWDLVKSLVD